MTWDAAHEKLPAWIRNSIYVGRFSPVAPQTRCWTWCGRKSRTGHGRLRYDGAEVSAHRFIYQFFRGPIGPKVNLDHLCRNRACVRPSHLEPVTGRENTLRGRGPTAKNARKVRCKKGHALVKANVYLRPGSRRRECRKCRAVRAQAHSRARPRSPSRSR